MPPVSNRMLVIAGCSEYRWRWWRSGSTSLLHGAESLLWDELRA